LLRELLVGAADQAMEVVSGGSRNNSVGLVSRHSALQYVVPPKAHPHPAALYSLL